MEKLKNMKEKFISFLKKHGALRKYKYNLKHHRTSPAVSFDEFINENNVGSLFLAAFHWDKTVERHHYWDNMRREWENEYEKR